MNITSSTTATRSHTQFRRLALAQWIVVSDFLKAEMTSTGKTDDFLWLILV